jgi:hypothetical protein
MEGDQGLWLGDVEFACFGSIIGILLENFMRRGSPRASVRNRDLLH